MENGVGKKVTIDQVAKLCGVSKTTVSRFLNHKYENISEETRRRIERVIEELDYRPNRSAQRLKASRSMLIGCCIGDLSGPFSGLLLRGITRVCEAAGYPVLFADSSEDARKERKARAEELLSPFDLMKVAKQPAYTLSGGERRKLEIARALVRNPAILMLDEPFAGVDPLSVNEIQDIVRRLAKQGLGIIITDHNVRETLSVVDRAYMVYNGRLLKEGRTAELVNDPEVKARYLGDGFRM